MGQVGPSCGPTRLSCIPFCCSPTQGQRPGEMELSCRQAPGSSRAGGSGKRSGKSRVQCRGELCLELNTGQASHP